MLKRLNKFGGMSWKVLKVMKKPFDIRRVLEVLSGVARLMEIAEVKGCNLGNEMLVV